MDGNTREQSTLNEEMSPGRAASFAGGIKVGVLPLCPAASDRRQVRCYLAPCRTQPAEFAGPEGETEYTPDAVAVTTVEKFSCDMGHHTRPHEWEWVEDELERTWTGLTDLPTS